MKNKIFIYSIILIFSSSSCQKWLEETHPTAVDNSFTYTTVEGLKAHVVSLYNRERSMARTNNTKNFTIVRVITDIAAPRGGYSYERNYNPVRYNPINFAAASSLWPLNYRLIERANGIIKAVPDVSMSEDERNQILAEAKCHRAQAYFTLIRLFDNIYLTTEPFTPEAAVNPNTEYRPAKSEDVFELINSDLDFAIEHLEWTDLPGKHTQASARHIRAKAAMWQKDWTAAIEHCEAIVNSGNFQLLDTDIVFGKYTGERNHNETLYAIQFDFENQQLGGGSTNNFFYSFATRYYRMNGMIPEAAQGGYPLGWAMPNNYLLGLYDQTNDKRYDDYYRDFFIYNDPSNLPDNTDLGDTLKITIEENPIDFQNMAISLWKSYDPNMPDDNREGFADIIIYRLAETHLIAAEAYMRNDNNDKAVEHINKVRTRAGISDLETVTEQHIMDERARELAFEGQRWFFLKRIEKLVEQVKNYAGFDHIESSRLGRDYIQDYNTTWPIPDSELILMKGYPQNPGY